MLCRTSSSKFKILGGLDWALLGVGNPVERLFLGVERPLPPAFLLAIVHRLNHTFSKNSCFTNHEESGWGYSHKDQRVGLSIEF